jgi:hypothetical protein
MVSAEGDIISLRSGSTHVASDGSVARMPDFSSENILAAISAPMKVIWTMQATNEKQPDGESTGGEKNVRGGCAATASCATEVKKNTSKMGRSTRYSIEARLLKDWTSTNMINEAIVRTEVDT